MITNLVRTKYAKWYRFGTIVLFDLFTYLKKEHEKEEEKGASES
ncbi:MAG: hypothetical protein ACXAEU_24100 [Candidatus Hodarchaeales archaeon]